MNTLKNKIDFIFLIEHPKRELEFEDIPPIIDSFANEAPPKIKTVKELYSISKAIESKTNEEFNSFIENFIMIKKRILLDYFNKVTY